jgi:DNA repair exonuclease SbcCD ATPase subunit
MADYDDYRQSKLEDAITKLTEISADLNKMIAVHELRISQQEKTMDSLVDVLERRRDEVDGKLNNVYNTMRSEDKNILEELENMREDFKEQYDKISKKISDMEKMMWTYMGGFSVIAFFLAYGDKILELVRKI